MNKWEEEEGQEEEEEEEEDEEEEKKQLMKFCTKVNFAKKENNKTF